MPRQALGIPDRDFYGDPLAGLSAGQLADWVVQRHKAERAGEHYDIRFGTPETGLYSWASRKGLPAPGEKRLAVMQPVHAHGYKDFKGEIREGYGKGTVERQDLGQVLVSKIGPDAIHFSTAHRRFPERYVLLKPKKGNNWLMLNTTKTEPIPYEKLHYKLVPQDKAEDVLNKLQPGTSTQAKIDGAAALVQLYKDHFDVLSYRNQKEKGYPIVHTERVFGQRPTIDIPKEYQGRTLRGELYGEREGKPIPPHELGGLLNSSIAKSLADQEAKKIKLKVMLFDIMNKQHKHQLDVPYEQRMAETRQVGSVLPQDTFNYPEEAKTPEEAKALLGRVQAGTEPSTVEGVVVHPPTGVPSKIKLRDEHDVHIREFFPGMGKYEGRGVGGFRYSHEPEGPIVGEVGTGFSDEERMKMHTNPEDFLGRVARVTAQNKKPSGALFAPSYTSLHEDYPMKTAYDACEVAEAIMYQQPSVLDSIKARQITGKYNLNDYIKEAANALRSRLSVVPQGSTGFHVQFTPQPGAEPRKVGYMLLGNAQGQGKPAIEMVRLDEQFRGRRLGRWLYQRAAQQLPQGTLVSGPLGSQQPAAKHVWSSLMRRPPEGGDVSRFWSMRTLRDLVKGQLRPEVSAGAYASVTMPPAARRPVSSELQTRFGHAAPVAMTPTPAAPTPAAPTPVVQKMAGAIKSLIKAKERSDVKDYRSKTDMMRQLLRTKPHEFEVDSDKDDIVGLTHTPTKFKIHLPKKALPTEFVARLRA